MFGKPPKVIGKFDADCSEMMFYLYLPIYCPRKGWHVPPPLERYRDIIHSAVKHASAPPNWRVYITAKTLYCDSGCLGAREGWHTDGFGTDDLNYIWCDRSPTIFCIQNGLQIRDCEQQSMMDMEDQCVNKTTYPDKTLLALDQYVIHRANNRIEPGVRTFVRISLSPTTYNLIGNSINYDLPLGIPYVRRQMARNVTSPALSEAAK